jgi:uncharacterized protein YjbJ (UPF0337 family)
MDKERSAHHWGEGRGHVKARWTRLTDRELDEVRGNAEVLIGRIQEKYEEPRKAIEMRLTRLLEEAQRALR